MKTTLITLSLMALMASSAFAAGSPSKAPSIDREIKYYNKGVDLMMEKKFSKAEKQFRKALDRKERFAEAHNNLAYVLRKQGPNHFDEALSHYNRAIAINPRLSQPYMYRGVLYVQMGDTDSAEKDLAKLSGMDPELASELEYVIETGREKEPEQFFGVSPKKG